jgi:hypothetical protein
MGDFILREGDKAIFDPAFGVASVVVQPGDMKASGPATIQGKKLCVAGDEARLSVPGCMYTTATHPIPGQGTLKILALGGDQTAKKTDSGGKHVLLKGTTFQAKFEVQSPAQQPSPWGGPPIPDPVAMYLGIGRFITTNTLFQGS